MGGGCGPLLSSSPEGTIPIKFNKIREWTDGNKVEALTEIYAFAKVRSPNESLFLLTLVNIHGVIPGAHWAPGYTKDKMVNFCYGVSIVRVFVE